MKRSSAIWGRLYGGNEDSLLHRPLIPVLLSLCMGIGLTAHLGLEGPDVPFLPLLLVVVIGLCLASALLIRHSGRFTFLLLAFLFTGSLLALDRDRPSALLQLTDGHDTVVLEGTVSGPLVVSEDGIGKVRVRVRDLVQPHGTISVEEQVLLSIYRESPPLSPGDRIRFPCRIRPFRNFNNPGGFDYVLSMRLKGLACSAAVSDGRRIVPMGAGTLPFPHDVIEPWRGRIRAFLEDSLSPRNAEMYKALVLGERDGVDPAIRKAFNRTGLGHILAVSGLHVGLVGGMAFFLFRWLWSRPYGLALRWETRKAAALLTMLPVVGYTLLSGFQVSGQRAMVMALVFLFSLVVGREREVWSSLALAALIVLFLTPEILYGTSFQLSFGAVVGILWLVPLLWKRIPPLRSPEHPDPGLLRRLAFYGLGLMAVTVAATVFLLPLTVRYFHHIPLLTIPANLTTVPLLGFWVLPLGLASVILLPLSPWTSLCLLKLGSFGLDILLTLVHFWAHIPWASIWVFTPNNLEILLYYAFLLFLWLSFRARWARFAFGLVIVLVVIDVAYWVLRVNFNRELRITYLDVGNGNASLVEFPGGKKMIIDGGGFPRGRFDTGEMVVAPFLWQSKIGRIHYMVLSHPQSDHMNGLRFLARHFHPQEFWYNGDEVKTASYQELMGIVHERGIRKRLPLELAGGQTINGVLVEVLHPLPGPGADALRDLNNRSLVVRLSFGASTFLFPGDLERQGEAVLVSTLGQALESRVLLVPHHGSRSSSTQEFLEWVRPGLCVISCRDGIGHRFPHEDVLNRLEETGCQVVSTSRSGAVSIRAGPESIRLTTFLGNHHPHSRP